MREGDLRPLPYRAALDNRDIGLALKRHRKVNGLKQREIGFVLGVGTSTITRIESGKRKLTLQEGLFIDSLFPGFLERLSSQIKGLTGR